ncbi:hypothetical protein FDO65_12825 [Nakamurella flava]|uniref:ABC transporter permease n=1 Tax=Nakamurella flava TaxID=2576308 RepID=A0A4U6QE86_9ACTN|nr:hypothetical protein [Nakamurella flava]TKV58443.1 hypothetical protein FDO65_12825 [Nakamurella flava]
MSDVTDLPPGSSRMLDRMPQDVRLAVRLAVPRGRAGTLRCALVVVGIAGCVAVLLFLTAFPGAVQARQVREVAVTPAPVQDGWSWTTGRPVAGGEFFAARWEVTMGGHPVHGEDLFAPDPSSTPLPPGVTRFPGPGELVVSPALAHLLADGTARPPAVEGTVIGEIAPDGLLGPDDLRFYRGTAAPTAPTADGPLLGTAATGWGHGLANWERRGADPADRPTTVLLVAGSVVTGLTAVGLLVLLARLDGVTAVRQSVALRLLGVSTARRRRVGAVRGAILALVTVVLGAAGFAALRAGAGQLRLGPSSFFPSDLTVPSAAAALVVMLVGAVMIRVGTRLPDRVDLAAEEHAPPRPFGAQLAFLLAASITLALAWSAGADSRGAGRLVLGTMTLALLAVLGAVAVLVPWSVDVLVDRPGVVGDPRERRVLSRPFGAAAGLLTAVFVLLAVVHSDDAGAGLVATARTGLWVAVPAVGLFLVAGTVLAADRLGPRRRSELAAAVLLPTAVGVVLAVPTAGLVIWAAARAAHLEIPTAAPWSALVWAVAIAVLMTARSAPAGPPAGRTLE